MHLINTHSHVYSKQCDEDRDAVIARAKQAGITHILLPDIDAENRQLLDALVLQYPQYCIPMLGIHPTSVSDSYKDELAAFDELVSHKHICAIGEIGLDLYWDTTYYEQQKMVCAHQIHAAYERELPIVIHVRNAFPHIFELLDALPYAHHNGVFHCFSGSLDDALRAIDMGFYIGVGGVLTYKKSGLDDIVQRIGLHRIVLETDDPWLPPVPHRGKRNEPAYITYVAQKLADILNCSIEEVAQKTSENAKQLFQL